MSILFFLYNKLAVDNSVAFCFSLQYEQVAREGVPQVCVDNCALIG